jgi:RNA polymerase sigma-70 factor (ECF subfamily)
MSLSTHSAAIDPAIDLAGACVQALAPLAGASATRTLAAMAETDDRELMIRYAAGDLAAFDALYARHRAPLWRFLLHQLRDTDIVSDVFQEIWSRVISHRREYVASARFSTWLFRIAHNCCVDHWRSSARRARRTVADADGLLESLPDDPARSPERHAEDDEAAAALHAAVGTLPEAQRAAFLLYCEAGLSLDEIAAVTGVGAETAKSRLRYAVAKLREALGPSAAEDAQ